MNFEVEENDLIHELAKLKVKIDKKTEPSDVRTFYIGQYFAIEQILIDNLGYTPHELDSLVIKDLKR